MARALEWARRMCLGTFRSLAFLSRASLRRRRCLLARCLSLSRLAVFEVISVGVGFTGYYYTDDFDDTYEEVNLSVGYGPVSIGYSFGEWDGDGGQDYDFLDISIDLGSGFYGTYGSFGDEFDGDYFELGYGTTVSDIDVGVALIFPSDEIEQADGENGNGEGIVFSLGKSF